MSKWTHNICMECWNKKEPNREPVSMVIPKLETCRFCNTRNIDGIYIRENPDTINTKGESDV